MKNIIAPLCSALSVNSECQTCSDATGSGVITSVIEGGACLQTGANKCLSGACTGKKKRFF